LRSFLTFAILCALVTAAEGQDRHDWQSLAQLRAGDRIRLSLKTGPVEGAFRSWTPQEVTAGMVTARREDVRKIERYREGGWGRGKQAALGAAIGFGGGFAIGAAAGGCHPNELLCVGRGPLGAAIGGVGALAGAGIGALIRPHRKDLIYAAK
jgi:MFS family permease